MKKILGSFFFPSEHLVQSNFNNFYILNLDCYFYEDENHKELVLMEDAEPFGKDVYLFHFPELGLIECYKILNKIEESSCFNYSYLSTFSYFEATNAEYMLNNFNIDFDLFLEKLNILND